MRLIALFALAAMSCLAQTTRWSGTTGEVAVNSTSYNFTIQQPASGAKAVSFEQATVNCTAACKVTFSQNGTGATNTAGTLTAITPGSGTPATKLFTNSNVGAGTAVPGTVYVGASAQQTIDLSKITLPATSSIAVNFTITVTTTSTCTVNMTIFGSER